LFAEQLTLSLYRVVIIVEKQFFTVELPEISHHMRSDQLLEVLFTPHLLKFLREFVDDGWNVRSGIEARSIGETVAYRPSNQWERFADGPSCSRQPAGTKELTIICED
jgi:hypothetical protein